MAKYRSKPEIVDAVQWFKPGDHPEDSICPIPNHFLALSKCPRCGENIRQAHGWIQTSEGGMVICPGHWVVEGTFIGYFDCAPDRFELDYELVTED